MKSYPSITKDINPYTRIYAFDKIDGSNIRGEFNNKKGFYKFGSRNTLIDENTPTLGKSIAIIKEKFEKDIAAVFKKNNWKDGVCFLNFMVKIHLQGNILTLKNKLLH